MFDVQKIIQKRLSLLTGEFNNVVTSNNTCVNTLDVTKEGITRSLIQSGILNENGKLKELHIK